MKYLTTLCLLVTSTLVPAASADLLDPQDSPETEFSEKVIQEFISPKECSDYVMARYGFVEDFEFWSWFQRFAINYDQTNSRCDAVTGRCRATFFTDLRGDAQGGGCNLIGTPFESLAMERLNEQVNRLESREPSLDNVYYGISCKYINRQTPFEGECELLKKP